MQLCDNGHGEVCFEGAWQEDCPACVYAEEIREGMQEQIDDLKKEIEEHECE